ncbi:type IV pilus twitching motility protein PilT [Vibrio sp.]|uniref:type IV pilus twitching motility protein PilT n=1 Tax=Vibrio sp. TaxID=678 RepID=UPI003AA80B7B
MDIAELLEFSVKHNASDLHLSAGVPPILRIDGDIRQLEMPAFTHSDVHALVFDIMNDAQRSEFEEKLEIDFSFELPNIGRFRVNAFNQSRGCAAVFRTIPVHIPSFEDISAPEIFEKIANYEKGLVLVTGPTGSGKSTTLAAMVDYINRNHKKHILTIEDPIEFTHNNKKCLVNQREVHRDTHSFEASLRSALREDPDVILVGELRDKETISLALTAAETGHLVFGTLHTSSAAKTIDRIIDVFPGTEKNMVRSMLSESLRAVIAQKLLKREGDAGGRIACHEVMIATPAIRNLVREDKVAQMLSMIQTGSSIGMQTMEQAARQLLMQGLVTQEEIESKIETLASTSPY